MTANEINGLRWTRWPREDCTFRMPIPAKSITYATATSVVCTTRMDHRRGYWRRPRRVVPYLFALLRTAERITTSRSTRGEHGCRCRRPGRPTGDEFEP